MSANFDYNTLAVTGGTPQRAFSEFPDPFFDYMSTQMPRTIQDVLRWAEAAWHHNGTYREACRRIIKFFLTEVDYAEVDDEEKERWKEFHRRIFKLFDHISALGEDRFCYGNSFSSIFVPFMRYLRCPRCRREWPIRAASYIFRDWQFITKESCKCGHSGLLKRVDRRSVDEEKIHPIRWNPHLLKIRFNPVSYDTRYYMKIPEEMRTAIRTGDKFYLETTPWEFIEAVRRGRDFEFNQGVIYHMKEEAVAGIRNMGWGIPGVLSNLRQIYYLQVLKRYDEAIALDYIIPLRIITPKAGSSRVADPLRNLNLGGFAKRMQHLLQQRRRDPAMWSILPFTIEYAAYGGDAKQIFTHELKTIATDDLLNASGIPAELYKLSLTTQAAPMALRIFTQLWNNWSSGIDGWLDWSTESIANAFSWDQPRTKMKSPTIADDLELRQIQLQLAAARQISMGTPLESLGMEYKKEVDKQMEETRYRMEQDRKFKEEMDNMALQQGMTAAPSAAGGAPGGMGAPAGMGAPGMLEGSTPGDINEMAEQLAREISAMPTVADRRRRLSQVRKSNETLYSVVKTRMDSIRQQAGAAGRQALVVA